MVEESSMKSWRRRRNLALAEADDASSDLGREFSYRNFLRMGWKVPVLEVPGWLDDTTVCGWCSPSTGSQHRAADQVLPV